MPLLATLNQAKPMKRMKLDRRDLALYADTLALVGLWLVPEKWMGDRGVATLRS